MIMTHHTKILGTGKYLPPHKVSLTELSIRVNAPPEWIFKKSGVKDRFYVKDETHSQMGAKAAQQALTNAGLSLHDIDLIVSASGTTEQLIPSNAALIHRELALHDHPIATFDINSTCLSFITAFDVVSSLIAQGRYKNALIVSSEIASLGINFEDPESCILFGDGAAAVVVGAEKKNNASKVLTARMETYSEGTNFCEMVGGGMKLHASQYTQENHKKYLFHMDGPKVFKLVSKHLLSFIDRLLSPLELSLDDIKLVIPHQASAMAMRIMQSKLQLSDCRFMNIIENHGNTIAASIPMTLHEGIQRGTIQRGDRVLLLGTSAGISIGAIVFEY